MWLPLSEDQVNEDGYYWYRDNPESAPEIVQSRMVFGSLASRELAFPSAPHDIDTYSVDTVMRQWPGAQVSLRIQPPIG